MSRGIRGNTLDRVLAARSKDPLAPGPIIGELAVRQNIPASLIAELADTHEQTVMRWAFGQSEVPAWWLPKMTQILSLLLWRRYTNALPLIGTTDEKRATIYNDSLNFKAFVQSGSRARKAVA